MPDVFISNTEPCHDKLYDSKKRRERQRKEKESAKIQAEKVIAQKGCDEEVVSSTKGF